VLLKLPVKLAESLYHRLSKIKPCLYCFDYFACPNGIIPGWLFTKFKK